MPAREISSGKNKLGYRRRTFQDLGDNPQTVLVRITCTDGGRHPDKPRVIVARTWAADGDGVVPFRNYRKAWRRRDSAHLVKSDGFSHEVINKRCPSCGQAYRRQGIAVDTRIERFASAILSAGAEADALATAAGAELEATGPEGQRVYNVEAAHWLR